MIGPKWGRNSVPPKPQEFIPYIEQMLNKDRENDKIHEGRESHSSSTRVAEGKRDHGRHDSTQASIQESIPDAEALETVSLDELAPPQADKLSALPELSIAEEPETDWFATTSQHKSTPDGTSESQRADVAGEAIHQLEADHEGTTEVAEPDVQSDLPIDPVEVIAKASSRPDLKSRSQEKFLQPQTTDSNSMREEELSPDHATTSDVHPGAATAAEIGSFSNSSSDTRGVKSSPDSSSSMQTSQQSFSIDFERININASSARPQPLHNDAASNPTFKRASQTTLSQSTTNSYLRQYKVLSFDIYGTLINWETGIYDALLSRLDQTTLEHTLGALSADDLRTSLLSIFHTTELKIQKDFPTLPYPLLLKEVFMSICERLELKVPVDKALSFGQTIANWPPFKDSVSSLKICQKYYKIVVLSNVSSAAFNAACRNFLEGVCFDAIYTAEDIGSYKPDVKNFHYLVDHVYRDFRVAKDEILHVANSFTHDHVPLKKVGMQPGVWIERRGERAIMSGCKGVEERLKSGKVEFSGRYKTLREFGDAVKEAWEGHSLI